MNYWPGLKLAFLPICLAAGVAAGQYLETQIPVGESPQQCLWNPISNKVYVSNEQDGTVTVIDGATNQVRATIAVAGYPYDICCNPVMNKVYVASRESNRLNVIDGSGDSLIREVSIPHRPGFITFNVAMNKIYVAYDDDPYAGIAVLDGTTDDVLTTLPVRGVRQLLWIPTTNRVLCYTDWDADTIKAIDCETDEVVVRMPVPSLAGLAWCYNPVNNLAYLPLWRTLCAASADGDSIVAEVPVDLGGLGTVCVMPRLNKLYGLYGMLYSVDCATNTVGCSLYVGGGEATCDTVKLKVYTNGGGVRVVDALSDTVIASISCGTTTSDICCNTTNSRVYLTDYRANCIWVVRDTSAAIAEPDAAVIARGYQSATVTRGTLHVLGRAGATLYNASGQCVAALSEGWNDISRLARGTYFLRSGPSAVSVRKVVVTK